MTKNEKEELLWRFKQLPTAGEVAALVEQGVLSKEEARALLFNSKDEKDKQEEHNALKEQIKFQQDVIDKLISQLSRTNNLWTFTQTYRPRYSTEYWMTTTGTNYGYSLGSSGSVVLCSTNSGNISGGSIEGTKLSDLKITN